MKNRHGVLICNNCHRPTTRIFGVDVRQLWDNLSCSAACDDDLSALLDGVPLSEVMAGGRSTDCSCIGWCVHCADPDVQSAAAYFDAQIAPGLRASGTPDAGLDHLRNSYVTGAIANTEAMQQIRTHFAAQREDHS